MAKADAVGRMRRACLATAILAVVGCGGKADFGESIVVSRARHTPVEDALGAGRTVRLPADVPFNVADAQRFSQGDAAAGSSADPSGRADCKASARPGGSAWAEFQLGHVLIHGGDQPFDATVTFNVAYGYRTEGEGAAPQATADRFALKIYIMDSNRRSLKKMMLAELDLAKGPATWTGTQSPAFEVTLEPRLAYHLVLAGRVEVSAGEDRSPSAVIEVRSLDIEIAPKS